MSGFFAPEIISDRVGDCGCPEREMVIGMAVVTVHLEPDGDGDCHIDMGEYEHEVSFNDCKSMEDLTNKAVELISSFGIDNNL